MNATNSAISSHNHSVLGQIVSSSTRVGAKLVKVEDTMPGRSSKGEARYVAKTSTGKKVFGTISVSKFGDNEGDETYFFREDGYYETAEAATSAAKPFEAGVTISINLKWIEDMKGDVGRLEGKAKEFLKVMGKGNEKKEKSSRSLFRTSMRNGIAVMEIDGAAFRIVCKGYLSIAEPAIEFCTAVAKMGFSKLIKTSSELMEAKLELRTKEIESNDAKK